MSCCGSSPEYDDLKEVSRLVSAQLAAFLRTLRDAGSASGRPSRLIAIGPSIRTATAALPPARSNVSDSTGISTPATTFATTPGRYLESMVVAHMRRRANQNRC